MEILLFSFCRSVNRCSKEGCVAPELTYTTAGPGPWVQQTPESEFLTIPKAKWSVSLWPLERELKKVDTLPKSCLEEKAYWFLHPRS